MIAAYLYPIIYNTTIIILSIYCINKYCQYNESRVSLSNRSSGYGGALLLTIAFTIFFGLRPIAGIFVDMMNYTESYYSITDNKSLYTFDSDTTNLIFDNLFRYLASNEYEIVIFFLLISIIYFGCIFIALKQIFPQDLFYALVIYLSAFSTFSYATNGIKAGAAASLFLLAFAFYKKPIIAFLFCFISLGFHHSMSLVIYAFILAYFVKNPKYFFIGWCVCLVLSFFNIEGLKDILAEFADEQDAERYILTDDAQWGGKTGFRWDFILYGLPPIIVGYWTIYKQNIIDRLYQLLLCTYLAANGAWLLCMYIPFNNRIAYLSWFILPVIISYPFFKFKLYPRQYITLNYIVAIYLAFTVSFSFIFS